MGEHLGYDNIFDRPVLRCWNRIDLHYFSVHEANMEQSRGTQFTAYMSILNTSVVFAYTLTERMISVFNYTSAIYIGAALTLVTTFFLLS